MLSIGTAACTRRIDDLNHSRFFWGNRSVLKRCSPKNRCRLTVLLVIVLCGCVIGFADLFRGVLKPEPVELIEGQTAKDL